MYTNIQYRGVIKCVGVWGLFVFVFSHFRRNVWPRYLEGQLPIPATMKNYAQLLRAGSVASPVQIETWSDPWWGTGPHDAGRACCLGNMSRFLGASRTCITLPGPDSIKAGTKWWHQNKKSTLHNCHSEFRQGGRSREALGKTLRISVEVASRFTQRWWINMLKRQRQGQKEKEKNESKPKTQLLGASKRDWFGTPQMA